MTVALVGVLCVAAGVCAVRKGLGLPVWPHRVPGTPLRALDAPTGRLYDSRADFPWREPTGLERQRAEAEGADVDVLLPWTDPRAVHEHVIRTEALPEGREIVLNVQVPREAVVCAHNVVVKHTDTGVTWCQQCGERIAPRPRPPARPGGNPQDYRVPRRVRKELERRRRA